MQEKFRLTSDAEIVIPPKLQADGYGVNWTRTPAFAIIAINTKKETRNQDHLL
jgi:hypothetical protein